MQEFERLYALRARTPAAAGAGPNLQIAPAEPPSKAFFGVMPPHVLRQMSLQHRLSVSVQADRQELLSDAHTPMPQWLPPELLVLSTYPETPHKPNPSTYAYKFSPRPRSPRLVNLPLSANMAFHSMRTLGSHRQQQQMSSTSESSRHVDLNPALAARPYLGHQRRAM